MQVKDVPINQTFETSSGEMFRMIKKTKKEIFFENIVSRKLHRQTLDVANMDVVIIKDVLQHIKKIF